MRKVYLAGALCLLVGFAVATVGQTTAPPVAARTPQLEGRYQIVFNPIARQDVFLLDTQTGKTWMHVQYPAFDGNPLVWIYATRLDSSTERMQWEIKQTLKEPDAK